MKRVLALTLALLMLFALAACGKKEEAEEPPVFKVGVLADVTNVEFMSHLLNDHGIGANFSSQQTEESRAAHGHTQYATLNAMLLDLNAGKINCFGTCDATAAYLLARDTSLVSYDLPLQEVAYGMVTLDTNTELYDILNNAIKELKADGTLATLIQTNLYDISGDPAPAEIPVTEGAKTYKIAVTGDLPPMDYVSADGKPAGFNVALLSEIAKRAGVNFELVVVESTARVSALASGRVDAYFWTMETRCSEHPDIGGNENLSGSLVTEEYVAMPIKLIYKKK